MTPGQLSALAAVHAVANGNDEPAELEQARSTSEGTIGDLMTFASMRRA